MPDRINPLPCANCAGACMRCILRITTDRPPVLLALREIGYEGDFTFEAHSLVRRMPAACQAEAIRLLYQIGAHMVEEAGKW